MNTSDVLNEAADLIEQHGWARGPFAWNGYKEGASELCLEGGIMAALGVDNGQRSKLYRDCPAYDAVARHVGFVESPWSGYGHDELWQWNDDPDRTASEVIEVLRAAAVVEAARESDVAGVVAGYRAVVGEQVQA